MNSELTTNGQSKINYKFITLKGEALPTDDQCQKKTDLDGVTPLTAPQHYNSIVLVGEVLNASL